MRKRVAIVVVALACAYALKRHYSTATAGELRFILAPTAFLVSLASGAEFAATPRGWVSDELRFVIAPSCAGVNFFLVSFVALVLAFARSWRALAAAGAASFAATLVANTLRITIAIPLHVHHLSFGW